MKEIVRLSSAIARLATTQLGLERVEAAWRAAGGIPGDDFRVPLNGEEFARWFADVRRSA